MLLCKIMASRYVLTYHYLQAYQHLSQISADKFCPVGDHFTSIYGDKAVAQEFVYIA